MRLVITCASRESWPSTKKSLRARLVVARLALDDQPHAGAVAARRILGHRDDGAQQRDQIDRLGVVARQFGVEPRGVGNVADEPVEPAHVVLHDVEQPVARRARL